MLSVVNAGFCKYVQLSVVMLSVIMLYVVVPCQEQNTLAYQEAKLVPIFILNWEELTDCD